MTYCIKNKTTKKDPNPSLKTVFSHHGLVLKRTLFFVISIFLFFSFFPITQAATVTWDGSASTDWATDANWVGNLVPTSADDVVINGSYTNAPTLNLSAGTTTINSLTLGATVASTLTLSYGNATDNKLVVTGDVTIGATGTLTHTANATAQTHVVNLECNNLTIEAGGQINVNSRGYINGYGPGSTVYGDNSGGGAYGGDGGDGTHSVGGSAYGSITEPSHIGSAGGDAKYGSSGGTGVVWLN
jgi:hypothetical protein